MNHGIVVADKESRDLRAQTLDVPALNSKVVNDLAPPA